MQVFIFGHQSPMNYELLEISNIQLFFNHMLFSNFLVKFKSNPKANYSDDGIGHDVQPVFSQEKDSDLKFLIFFDVSFPAENNFPSFDVANDQTAIRFFTTKNCDSVSGDDCFRERVEKRFEVHVLNNLAIVHSGN